MAEETNISNYSYMSTKKRCKWKKQQQHWFSSDTQLYL
jgi:hypothetical protein